MTTWALEHKTVVDKQFVCRRLFPVRVVGLMKRPELFGIGVVKRCHGQNHVPTRYITSVHVK